MADEVVSNLTQLRDAAEKRFVVCRAENDDLQEEVIEAGRQAEMRAQRIAVLRREVFDRNAWIVILSLATVLAFGIAGAVLIFS